MPFIQLQILVVFIEGAFYHSIYSGRGVGALGIEKAHAWMPMNPAIARAIECWAYDALLLGRTSSWCQNDQGQRSYSFHRFPRNGKYSY